MTTGNFRPYLTVLCKCGRMIIGECRLYLDCVAMELLVIDDCRLSWVWHFSSHARIIGEGAASHCLPVPFFFFFKWRSAGTYRFFFWAESQSTVAQWTKTAADECFLMSCIWTHFYDAFTHCAWTALLVHSEFVGSRVYACLVTACFLYFWQNNKGLLPHCVTIE